MRIIHFLYDHAENPWLGGGGALRARAINTRLVRQGHQVTYVSGGYPNCPQGATGSDGTTLFTQPSSHYPLSRLFYTLQASRILQDWISTHGQPDLVVDDTSLFSYPLPQRVWPGPRVALVHNYLGLRSFRKLGPLGLLPWLGERYNFHMAKHYIAVSDTLRTAILAQQPKAHATVIHNGIDDQAFQAPAEAESSCIGFIGRLEIHQKGLDILLEALRILFARVPAAHAIIIGGGKDEQAFKHRIAQSGLTARIRCTGRLGPERFGELQKCQVVCMPSRYEGWGITALEAAALGIPVVASRIPGLNEAVQDGRTGVLVALDAHAFAQALERLLDNSAERLALGTAARSFAQNFRWDAVAMRQLEFYQEATQTDCAQGHS